jgi:hypothetical protein
MTDEEYVALCDRTGGKQRAYCAEVERKTGIPLAGIIERFERLDMKLDMCSDLPNPPLQAGQRFFWLTWRNSCVER